MPEAPAAVVGVTDVLPNVFTDMTTVNAELPERDSDIEMEDAVSSFPSHSSSWLLVSNNNH
jgi:hypothetical protein